MSFEEYPQSQQEAELATQRLEKKIGGNVVEFLGRTDISKDLTNVERVGLAWLLQRNEHFAGKNYFAGSKGPHIPSNESITFIQDWATITMGADAFLKMLLNMNNQSLQQRRGRERY